MLDNILYHADNDMCHIRLVKRYLRWAKNGYIMLFQNINFSH